MCQFFVYLNSNLVKIIYKFGTSPTQLIDVGTNIISINFSEPMPNVNYNVQITANRIQKGTPLSYIIQTSVKSKSTFGFSFYIYSGTQVDLGFDWAVYG